MRSIAISLAHVRPDGASNAFEGNILQRTFLGDLTEYVVGTTGPRWRVQALSSQPLRSIDERVWLSFDPTAANVVLDT